MMTSTIPSPFQLAQDVEVAAPDSATSPGARWLTSVYTDAVEAFTYARENDDDEDDTRHEVADSAVPVYTAERWAVFTDLCAWQEDLTEFGDQTPDMTERAGLALYLIAHRVCRLALDNMARED